MEETANANAACTELNDIFQKILFLHRNNALIPSVDSTGQVQRIQTMGELQKWLFHCEISYYKRRIIEQRQQNAQKMQMMLARRKAD